MHVGDPMSSVAKAVMQATLRDLPDGPHHVQDVDVYAHPTTFGDTSMGRGGIAGQAMTSCLTTVVICGSSAAVYRAGRLDYVVRTDHEFGEMLKDHNLPAWMDLSKSGLDVIQRSER